MSGLTTSDLHPDRRTLYKVLWNHHDVERIAVFQQELSASGHIQTVQALSQHAAGRAFVIVCSNDPTQQYVARRLRGVHSDDVDDTIEVLLDGEVYPRPLESLSNPIRLNPEQWLGVEAELAWQIVSGAIPGIQYDEVTLSMERLAQLQLCMDAAEGARPRSRRDGAQPWQAPPDLAALSTPLWTPALKQQLLADLPALNTLALHAAAHAWEHDMGNIREQRQPAAPAPGTGQPDAGVPGWCSQHGAGHDLASSVQQQQQQQQQQQVLLRQEQQAQQQQTVKPSCFEGTAASAAMAPSHTPVTEALGTIPHAAAAADIVLDQATQGLPMAADTQAPTNTHTAVGVPLRALIGAAGVSNDATTVFAKAGAEAAAAAAATPAGACAYGVAASGTDSVEVPLQNAGCFDTVNDRDAVYDDPMECELSEITASEDAENEAEDQPMESAEITGMNAGSQSRSLGAAIASDLGAGAEHLICAAAGALALAAGTGTAAVKQGKPGIHGEVSAAAGSKDSTVQRQRQDAGEDPAFKAEKAPNSARGNRQGRSKDGPSAALTSSALPAQAAGKEAPSSICKKAKGAPTQEAIAPSVILRRDEEHYVNRLHAFLRKNGKTSLQDAQGHALGVPSVILARSEQSALEWLSTHAAGWVEVEGAELTAIARVQAGSRNDASSKEGSSRRHSSALGSISQRKSKSPSRRGSHTLSGKRSRSRSRECRGERDGSRGEDRSRSQDNGGGRRNRSRSRERGNTVLPIPPPQAALPPPPLLPPPPARGWHSASPPRSRAEEHSRLHAGRRMESPRQRSRSRERERGRSRSRSSLGRNRGGGGGGGTGGGGLSAPRRWRPAPGGYATPVDEERDFVASLHAHLLAYHPKGRVLSDLARDGWALPLHFLHGCLKPTAWLKRQASLFTLSEDCPVVVIPRG